MWAMQTFFKFMGVSGWLVVLALFLENRVAFPISGTNWSLDALEMLTIAIWLIARWGHLITNKKN